MADEKVTIGIDSDYDGSGTNQAIRDMGKLNLVLKALGRSQNDYADSGTRMARRVADMDRSHNRLIKTLEKQNKILRMGLMPVLKLVTTAFAGLKAVLLPAGVALAGFVAALGGAKLALAAVDLGAKAWTLALKGLAAGAAVALGAVSSLAAAMTELRAAAAAPFTGVGTRQMQGIFGTLMGDPKIAALGVENIQTATTSLLKMKVPVGDLNKYLKELGDYAFYAGSGDAGKGIVGIIGAMKELGTGKMSADSLKTFAASFGEMGPAIEEAGKAFVGKDVQSFIDFLMTNPQQLEKFNNGMDEFNNTMIGLVKTFRPVMQAALEPFGQTLNDTLKGPLAGFRDFLVDLIKDVMPSVVLFLGTKMPGAIAKLQEVLTMLGDKLKEVLPTIDPEGDGFGGGVVSFFDSIATGWAKAKPVLEQLAAGFDVIWSFVKPIAAAFGGMLGRILMGGSQGLAKSADAWAAAGENIAKAFAPGGPIETSLQIVWDFVKVIAQTLAPSIVDMLVALKSPLYIFEEITSRPEALTKIGDGLSRIAKAVGPIFELIGDVIGHIIDVLPSVADTLADIAEFAGRLATHLRPVVNAFMEIAKQLGLIKLAIMWMIGRAVLGKMASLFGGLGGALGGAGGRAAVGAAGRGIGGALLGSPLTMLGTAGLVYGTANAGTQKGLAGSMLGGAALGTAIAGPIGTVAGLYGGFAYQEIFNPARVGDWTMSEGQAQAMMDVSGRYSPKNQFELGTFDRKAFTDQVRSVLGPMFEGLDLTNTPEFQDLINKTEDSQKQLLMNLQGFDKGPMMLSEVAALADQAGIDLTDGAMSLEEGIGLIGAQAKNMKEAGTLMAESLQQFVFDPRQDRRYQEFTNTIPELVGGMIENLGTVTADEAANLTDSVINQYLGKINAGDLSIGEGTAQMVEDLEKIRDALSKGDQREATIEVQQIIDDVILAGEKAATKAQEQKNAMDQMIQGVVDKFETTVPGVMSALDSSVSTLYNRISALSNIRFTVSADGRVSVTGGGSTYSSRAGSIAAGNGSPPPPPKSDGNGDTFTPRANLLNTQRIHSLVDSRLSGRRTVTSMWRNTDLGSSNSDHVTGRALDVVGDNLGGYARMIRSMGGFAEFHGTDAGRHLHVVPPQLPVGDRPTPRPPTNMPMQPQVQQTISTTVYAPPGMNEEMLARRTARAIAKAQRDAAERR